MKRDTSRDTAIVWYDPVRGYIFRDTEPAPEDAEDEDFEPIDLNDTNDFEVTPR